MNCIYPYYRVICVFAFIFYYILFQKKSPQIFYEKLRQIAFPYGQFYVEHKERFQWIKKENEKGQGCVIMSNHYGALDVCFIEKYIQCSIIVKNDLCGELVNEEEDGIQNFLRKQYFDKCLLIPYRRGNKESGIEIKKIIERETKNGKNILLFPEGTSQRCFKKPLSFRRGIFDLCFEQKIPIVSISLNYSKDIGFDRKDKIDFAKLCSLSPHMKIYCNGIYYSESYENSMEMMKEVYKSISENVYTEWKKEWEE